MSADTQTLVQKTIAAAAAATTDSIVLLEERATVTDLSAFELDNEYSSLPLKSKTLLDMSDGQLNEFNPKLNDQIQPTSDDLGIVSAENQIENIKMSECEADVVSCNKSPEANCAGDSDENPFVEAATENLNYVLASGIAPSPVFADRLRETSPIHSLQMIPPGDDTLTRSPQLLDDILTESPELLDTRVPAVSLEIAADESSGLDLPNNEPMQTSDGQSVSLETQAKCNSVESICVEKSPQEFPAVSVQNPECLQMSADSFTNSEETSDGNCDRASKSSDLKTPSDALLSCHERQSGYNDVTSLDVHVSEGGSPAQQMECCSSLAAASANGSDEREIVSSDGKEDCGIVSFEVSLCATANDPLPQSDNSFSLDEASDENLGNVFAAVESELCVENKDNAFDVAQSPNENSTENEETTCYSEQTASVSCTDPNSGLVCKATDRLDDVCDYVPNNQSIDDRTKDKDELHSAIQVSLFYD